MKKINNIQYILAHGAGAPSNSDWMKLLVSEIKKQSNDEIKITLFNFPYMTRRLRENKKIPPDRMPKLIDEWSKQILKTNKKLPLFIGGKSMGGRVATLLDFPKLDTNINGIINFGFPFHAPGKLPGDRISHLENFKIPCLINQGERDPMGSITEIEDYKLSKNITVNFLQDGNHDLKPRVKSGKTLEDNITAAVKSMINFIEEKL